MTLALVGVGVLYAISIASPTPRVHNSECVGDHCEKLGFFRESVDHSVNPCQNFHRHACGGILKRPGFYLKKMSKFKEELKNLMSTRKEKPSEATSSTVAKTARFFKTCLREATVRSNKEDHCYSLVEKYFPNSASRMYIESYFQYNRREVLRDMYDDVKDAFEEMLEVNKWLSVKEKENATDKLELVDLVLVFEPWIMFHHLLRNVEDCWITGSLEEMLERLRDRVSTCNSNLLQTGPLFTRSSYNRDYNTVIITLRDILPLHYGWFIGKKSLLYGTVGQLMAYQLMHGFDTVGVTSDGVGNKKNIFSKKTTNALASKSKCFRGGQDRMRFSEAIRLAYDAYFISIHGKTTGRRHKHSRGFANEKAFFIGAAIYHCLDALTNKNNSDRGNSEDLFMNNKDFAQVFGCPVGSRMNPKNKCTLW